MSERYVDVECTYKHHTDDAVLIAQNNDEFWVPRTCLDYRSDKLVNRLDRNSPCTLEIRQWFCDKKEIEYV